MRGTSRLLSFLPATIDYSYDSNGDRATTEVVPYNRVLSDDTYTYQYDDEGSLVYKYVTNDPSEQTYYTWDHRNRLVHVSGSINDHESLIVDYGLHDFRKPIVAEVVRRCGGRPRRC